MNHRWARCLLSAACLLTVLGCSKPDLPKPVQIAGTVKYANGKPVTGMVLTMHPQDDVNKGNLPIAVVNGPDGRFEVSCLPGSYKVTMAPIPISAGSAGGVEAPPSKAPDPGNDQAKALKSYRSPELSPWQITVLAAGNSEKALVVR